MCHQCCCDENNEPKSCLDELDADRLHVPYPIFKQTTCQMLASTRLPRFFRTLSLVGGSNEGEEMTGGTPIDRITIPFHTKKLFVHLFLMFFRQILLPFFFAPKMDLRHAVTTAMVETVGCNAEIDLIL